MNSKLSNWPLIRAYGTVGTIASLPAVVFTLFMVFISSDKSAANSTLRNQLEAASSSGTISASEITATASYPHLIVWWIVGSFAFYVLSGAVVRRLLGQQSLARANRLVEESRTAAGGDLRVEPIIDAGNEYGDLQRSFSAMIGGFRQTIGRIDHAAIDLRAAASEMAHTADEAGDAIGEVAQAIGSISEGASHQVSLVSHSSDLVAGIEASVRGTSEHAREAQRQGVDTERLSEEGMVRAAEVQEAMEAVRESSLKTATVVRSLGEKSSDIDLIVQAIAGIAQQTNMLALNASIEAARAGEQGKGFRNVAEEVRLLAEDAQSSAEQIAKLVTEIQVQTAQAVAAMENGIVRVEEGFDTVNRNRQTFHDISGAVRALNISSADISELAEGIARGTGNVRQKIEEVASVAEESSASTEEVSASTQQTSAAAEEVSASAQRVAQTAANLAELSGRFKLPGADAKAA